jgi:16S rRNA G966 N2-methylase RsmD
VTILQEIEAVAGAAAIMTAPRIARKAKIIIHPNMQFVRHVTGQRLSTVRNSRFAQFAPDALLVRAPWRKRGSGRSGSRRESDIRCIVNYEESVDLVYLDPPFNSDANYNVLFKEKSEQHSYAQMSCTYLVLSTL